MIVCALEYNSAEFAAKQGISSAVSPLVYPMDYLSISAKVGLAKNVGGTIGDSISRRSIAVMLYNAINAQLYTRSGNDFIPNRWTLLNNIFGIETKEEFDRIIADIISKMDDGSASAVTGEEMYESDAELTDEADCFADKDTDKINNSILSIHTTENGYVMVVKKGTEMDSLKKDDVFVLEGDENTPFGETYVGKISHITDNGDSLSVNLTEPALDEIFDKLSIDVCDVMQNDEIDEIYLAEGLRLDAGNSSSLKIVSATRGKYSDSSLNNKNRLVSTFYNGTSLYPVDEVQLLALKEDENFKFGFEGEVDLLKLFKLDKAGSPTTMVY